MDSTTGELGARLGEPGPTLRPVEQPRPGDPSALRAAPAGVLMEIRAPAVRDQSAAPSTALGRFTRDIEQSLRSHDTLEAAR